MSHHRWWVRDPARHRCRHRSPWPNPPARTPILPDRPELPLSVAAVHLAEHERRLGRGIGRDVLRQRVPGPVDDTQSELSEITEPALAHTADQGHSVHVFRHGGQVDRDPRLRTFLGAARTQEPDRPRLSTRAGCRTRNPRRSGPCRRSSAAKPTHRPRPPTRSTRAPHRSAPPQRAATSSVPWTASENSTRTTLVRPGTAPTLRGRAEPEPTTDVRRINCAY